MTTQYNSLTLDELTAYINHEQTSFAETMTAFLATDTTQKGNRIDLLKSVITAVDHVLAQAQEAQVNVYDALSSLRDIRVKAMHLLAELDDNDENAVDSDVNFDVDIDPV